MEALFFDHNRFFQQEDYFDLDPAQKSPAVRSLFGDFIVFFAKKCENLKSRCFELDKSTQWRFCVSDAPVLTGHDKLYLLIRPISSLINQISLSYTIIQWRTPFLHLKMPKIVQKRFMQKTGFSCKTGSYKDFSYNSVI